MPTKAFVRPSQRVSHDGYRPPDLPATISQCQTGEIHRLFEHRREMNQAAAAQTARLRELQAEHEQHRLLVENALPGDGEHYALLAASAAAMPVLDRAIGRARSRVETANGNLRQAEKELNLAWRDYSVIRSFLLEGSGDKPRRAGRELSEAEILAAAEQFIGPVDWD